MNKLVCILAILGVSISAFAACDEKDHSAQQLEEAEVSSPYQASELALRSYIHYLSKEQVLKPTLVGINQDIADFAKSGDQVWEVRIVNKEELVVLYFVHQKTGEVHMVCKPGEWAKNQCTEAASQR